MHLQKYIVHYRLRTGAHGHRIVEALDAFDASKVFCQRYGIAPRRIAGLLARPANLAS